MSNETNSSMSAPVQAGLLPCPFCGATIRFSSNRDWHKLVGEHTDDCVFDSDYSFMVPGDDAGLQWLIEAWNRRAAIAQHVSATPGETLENSELYRMRIAAICTAAIGYCKADDPVADEYKTPALADVQALYAKYAALYEAARTPAAPVVDLHAAIMRLPCKPDSGWPGGEQYSYKLGHRDARHAAAELVASHAPPGWQPIESAPKNGQTLLLGYFNKLGNWRTMRGQWYSQAAIDDEWEDPGDFDAGWYETAVEPDAPNCWAISPTHWQPLPPAPNKEPNNG